MTRPLTIKDAYIHVQYRPGTTFQLFPNIHKYSQIFTYIFEYF